MKINLYTLILCGVLAVPATSYSGMEGNKDGKNKNSAPFAAKLPPPSPSVIDAGDSVVFDLGAAIKIGNSIEFPVSIISDDMLNALDFSMRYNQIDFLYDTIIDLTGYLQETFFYNPNDSTLRFTSFSLTPIAKNTPLVKIRFTAFAGAMCNTDLDSLKGYLNGDGCSEKLINCVPLSLNDEKNGDIGLTLYPNPATEVLQLLFKAASGESWSVIITDLTGRLVYRQAVGTVSAHQPLSIDLRNFSAGAYQLQLVSPGRNVNRKFVIQ